MPRATGVRSADRRKKPLSEAEFLRLPDDGRKYELVDGEAKEVSAGFEHGVLAIRLAARLLPHVQPWGYVCDSSTGFRMANGRIRSPDVSAVARTRLPAEIPKGFFEGAPDLAIEIVSPFEDMPDLLSKVGEYFASGAKQVWLLFPETQQVVLYHSPFDAVRLHAGDEFTAGVAATCANRLFYSEGRSMRKYASANELLNICYERDASDIHIVPNEPPTLRLYGRLVRLEEFGELSPADTERLFREVAPPRAIHELERVRTADFGYTHEKARFRVAAYYEKGAIAINFRLIPYRLRSFEEIGLPDHVKRLLHLPRGLILVTGPTGSGKTTTLATMLDYINTHRETHIVTVEDPIEYFHEPKRSVVSQREVGVDVPSFEEGVIRALRMDPDVILVGEMRDLRTIQAAITAAETGHLVFSTVHTTGAARTVERIVDVFPMDQQEQIRVQLSTNLVAVISQLLLPRADRPGRVAAFEIMICTPAIGHMIRERKIHSIESAIQTGHQLGMITLDNHLLFLYQHKLISREEMYRVAQNPEEIAARLGETLPETALARQAI